MSGNCFGKAFSVSTFGESHGPALGAIVDGCPPGLAISEADIQINFETPFDMKFYGGLETESHGANPIR